MADVPATRRELLASFDHAVRRGMLNQLVTHYPPGVTPQAIADAFAATVPVRPTGTWEQLWDRWVAQHHGRVPVESARCEGCNGRRFDRRLGGACRVCAGRGHHRNTVYVQVRPVSR